MKVDHTLSILSVDKKLAYHPLYDDFPFSKEQSKTYFFVHPSSALPN